MYSLNSLRLESLNLLASPTFATAPKMVARGLTSTANDSYFEYMDGVVEKKKCQMLIDMTSRGSPSSKAPPSAPEHHPLRY